MAVRKVDDLCGNKIGGFDVYIQENIFNLVTTIKTDIKNMQIHYTSGFRSICGTDKGKRTAREAERMTGNLVSVVWPHGYWVK